MPNGNTDTAAEKFMEDAETLGGIQIIIGCMHIGFGTILGLMNDVSRHIGGFASTTFIGGYPFWGGVFFIISGSLSVSATKEFCPALIRSVLVMNIVSSFSSLVGVSLLLLDMIINGEFDQESWAVVSGIGISAMLLIFSLLEFCIACTTVYFARKRIC